MIICVEVSMLFGVVDFPFTIDWLALLETVVICCFDDCSVGASGCLPLPTI